MGGWMLYTIYVVMGLLLIDFLIGVFRAITKASLSPNILLASLKNILYHLFPLMVIVNLMSLDPTGWILLAFYYISGIALIWHYLIEIKNKWRA